jgi:hypothetical protein
MERAVALNLEAGVTSAFAEVFDGVQPEFGRRSVRVSRKKSKRNKDDRDKSS